MGRDVEREGGRGERGEGRGLWQGRGVDVHGGSGGRGVAFVETTGATEGGGDEGFLTDVIMQAPSDSVRGGRTGGTDGGRGPWHGWQWRTRGCSYRQVSQDECWGRRRDRPNWADHMGGMRSDGGSEGCHRREGGTDGMKSPSQRNALSVSHRQGKGSPGKSR